jgi:hypothetical protein
VASDGTLFDDLGEAPAAEATPRTDRRRRQPDVVRGRLKVHDPFELIRWLALSQPDPRKALAELVQNSMDAGARTIRVTRVRERGVPCLRILDDGDGVIPELERSEALRYVASHVGHSRKRRLSPQERLQLMTQGQYGIGLLGFWSLGEALEIRSSVPGQRPHRLVLYRDRPDYRIEPIKPRELFHDRWTEVVVTDLHRDALPSLTARRAADYLAGELRGQLLAREVELAIEDRLARGTADKRLVVRPRRFLGERLSGLERVDVPGFSPVHMEIHLAAEGDAEPIAIYGGGTLVAASFHELAFLLLDRPPWTDSRLTGFVDFPALTVAPGSRRGIVADSAAAAFLRALRSVEPTLQEALDALERREAEELDRKLVRDLQRAFRGFFREQSRYTLLPVQGAGAVGAGPGAEEGAAGEMVGFGEVAASPLEGDVGPGLAVEAAAEVGLVSPPAPRSDEDPSDLSPATAELPFPPGPLESVAIQPDPVRLYPGATRRVRARAADGRGRPAAGPITYHWRLMGDGVRFDALVDGEPEVVLQAGHVPGTAALSVVARSLDGREATALAEVLVRDAAGPGRSEEGIPEPELVEVAGAPWRSRILDSRWQVNSAHPEYRALGDSAALKLRYLALLFAKEVVLRSSQDPRLAGPLEQLVEIAAYADRNLAGRRRGGDR